MKEITLQEAALAWAQGKRVEAEALGATSRHWGPIHCLGTTDGYWNPNVFTRSSNEVRFRLAPEPPAKRYRPWTPEEVPVGACIRKKGVAGFSMILNNGATNEVGLTYTSNGGVVSITPYGMALELFEHSLDQIGTPASKRTWLPCGVEVEA